MTHSSSVRVQMQRNRKSVSFLSRLNVSEGAFGIERINKKNLQVDNENELDWI